MTLFELMYAHPWWTTLWLFLGLAWAELVLRIVLGAFKRQPRGLELPK